MTTDTNFYYKSYQLHQQSYINTPESETALYENWFDNGSVDVWRHLQMFSVLDPLLKNDPKAQWLTVGDGRYATSARYINNKGSNAVASDIDTTLLEIAKQKKWINSYLYANAESLPLEDNSFDYTFCKEAFHHFPRAYMGIYEMLRVSRKAVILSEPFDWLPPPMPRRMLQIIKRTFKKGMHMPIAHTDTGNYEPNGNYIFNLSMRDLEKIALGLHLPFMAFKKFHDVYIKGVEQESLAANGPLLRRMRKQLKIHRIKTSLGLCSDNHIAAVLFKEWPAETMLNDFRKLGFTVVKLPTNPYLTK